MATKYGLLLMVMVVTYVLVKTYTITKANYLKRLQEAMTDHCELIYVDDLEAHYVEDAIVSLYQDLYEDKEQEITDELIEQGYEWPEKVEA